MPQFCESALAAVSKIEDGATILIGGFGRAGQPVELIDALIQSGASDLKVVSNNAGNGDTGLAALIGAGRVSRITCSFPRQVDSYLFEKAYEQGRIQLELVPQGTLAERIRAGGSGIGAFYTPTGFGTELAEGKETRIIQGRGHVLEFPIAGDFALIKAFQADRAGNLVYRKTSRNFGPIMATAATATIAQVTEILPNGAIDPDRVVTPGIYTHTIVQCAIPQESP